MVIPFDYFAGHCVLLQCRLDDRRDAKVIFDTGSGVSVLSETLLAELGHPVTGRVHRGRRMSGQELVLPLTDLGSVTIDTLRRAPFTVAAFDMSRFSVGGATPDGLLSLGLFETTPVTEDRRSRTLVVEDPASLRRREGAGISVPVRVRREGVEVSFFLDLQLPSGRVARVEVDTGSDDLILHERFMGELGISPGAAGVRTVEGSDETGHRFVRYGANLKGAISPAGFDQLAQRDPPVIFQNIIYDGLIGHSFFRPYAVTYDLPRSRIIFSR